MNTKQARVEAKSPPRRGTILVVEDEAIVAEDLSGKLGHLGYDVLGPTARGEDAVVIADQSRPDVVLMDIRLQGRMDGVEAAEKIRGESHLPVIYLTAHNDRATLDRAKLTRPFGYLLKPFDEHDLETAIEMARYKHQADEALRQSEEQLRLVTDNTPAFIAYIDADYRYRFVNRQYEDWLGRPREEILGRTTAEVLGEATAALRRSYMERALAGEMVQFESELPFRDSTPRWVVTQFVPHGGAGGHVLGFYVLTVDVTMRKKNEEGMRKQEEFIRRILDSSHEIIEVLDLDGHCRSMSQGGQRLLDITDLIPQLGTAWVEFWQGADRDAAAQALARARAGEREVFQGSRPAATGRPKWWDVIVSPILDSLGQPELLLAVSRDITERKEAEAALRESEERISSLLNAAAEGFLGLDTQGRCTFANRAACRILGYEGPEALLGQLVHPLVHHHHADGRAYPAEECRVLQGLRQDTGCHVEGEVFWRRDGSCFPVEYWSLPLRAEGVTTGLVLTFLDVTERRQAEAAVRQAQTRLALALQAARMGSFEWNARTEATVWSDSYFPLLGYRLGEVVPSQDAWCQRVHAQDWPELAARLHRAIDGVEEFHAEYRVCWPDGSVRWHEALGRFYLGPRGEAEQMLGIVMDITARKEAESTLRLQAVALQSAANAIVITDAQGVIQWVNEAFTLLTGYQAAEALGKTPRVLKSGEQEKAFYEQLWTTILAGEAWHGELVNRHRDGRNYQEEMTITPVRARGGEITHFVAIQQDITQRKQAAEALARERNLLRTLIDHLPDCIYVKDADSRFLAANRTVALIMGAASPEELLGKSDADFYPPELAELYRKDEEILLHTGEPVLNKDEPHQAPDGSPRDILTTKIPIRDGRGKVIGLVGISHDITERKKMEAELRSLNAELEARVAARTAALTDTIARMEAESRQRARAQESLRQANQQLLARSEQLRHLALELTRVEAQERTRLVHVLHDHLQQLIVGARSNVDAITTRTRHEQLLAFAASASASLTEAATECRSLTVELAPPLLKGGGLAAALPWLAEWMKQKHGLIVTVDIAPGAEPDENGVASLLFHSAREALFNIVKHAGVRAARLTVTRSADDTLQLEIADEGKGFDPAVQVARAAQADGGGFGLFSIRDRLQLLGGQVEIHSTPGQGTRVILTLPLNMGQPLASASDSPREQAPPSPAVLPGHKLRILLADDHRLVRRGLAQILEAEPDFDVVGEATDGEAAVELAARLHPDLILMDVDMPKLGGIEATRRITHDQPGVRVVALTMHEDIGVADAMRLAGAEALVQKSAPTSQLLSTLRHPRPLAPEEPEEESE